ncbi:MAG: hypothetical protein NTV79_09740 [Candidatus Aureabacteria bacterium]|nr:hypothetical protein [Candidatus Auribacterota bacterium]
MLDKRFDPRLKRLGREWLLLCLLFVVCASLFSPQPVVPRGDADIRYLIALLPFLAGLLGLAAYFLWGKCRIVSAVFVLVLIFTNLLTLNPWLPLPLRFDLVSYLREIHSDYTTAYEAAVGFIRKNCRKDDVIVVVPPNMTFPLQFYAGDRVLFGGVVDRWTNLDREKVRSLNPSLLFEEVEPDWIVSFRLRDMGDPPPFLRPGHQVRSRKGRGAVLQTIRRGEKIKQRAHRAKRIENRAKNRPAKR